MALGKELLYILRAKDDASKEILKVKRSFDDTDASAGQLGKTLSLTSGILTREAGQSIKSFGETVLRSLGTFVDAGQESVRATQQLNAVLKSTGGVAGITASEIQNMASALSRVTNFSDDAVIAGSNVLLTYTGIAKDVFPRAQEATLDMAAALGLNLTSAAERVGNVLQYPSLALNSLTKQGFRFTEEQKNMIIAMENAGDMAGAQAIILGELELAYGGVARATVDSKTQMTNAMGELKESIGKTLLPALDSMAQSILPVIESVGCKRRSKSAALGG